MICPFSKKLCRECSFYVGRHYYLCLFKEYRGYLGDQVEKKPRKDLPTQTPQLSQATSSSSSSLNPLIPNLSKYIHVFPKVVFRSFQKTDDESDDEGDKRS
jgi:hypothetical protein